MICRVSRIRTSAPKKWSLMEVEFLCDKQLFWGYLKFFDKQKSIVYLFVTFSDFGQELGKIEKNKKR